MSKRVYKYPVPIRDEFVLDLPEGAQILHVAEQPTASWGQVTPESKLWLWALVDPEARYETRDFRLHGTGHEVEDPPAGCDLDFVATAITVGGQLVWHLFEVNEIPPF